MIRRLLWAGLGVIAGIAGYRKASRLAGTLRARDGVSFARDVRRGMNLYLEHYQQPAGRERAQAAPARSQAPDPRMQAGRGRAAPGGRGRRWPGQSVDEMKGGR